MGTEHLPDDFYARLKPRLYERIGRELRLARRIVDIGCGSCELVRYLADSYAQDIVGVDISPEAFPADRPYSGKPPIRCLHGDAASLEFAAEGSIDAVVTVWALHEMTQPQAILDEVSRVLRPGGEFLVVDFPRGSLAQRLWDEAYYTLEQVKAFLKGTGLVEVRGRLIHEEQLIWARGHQPRNGLSADAQAEAAQRQ